MAFMRSGVRSPSAPPSSSLSDTYHSRYGSRRWTAFAGGVFLFCATALTVVWQNSRLAVLWDLSYVLENAYRISIGDIPYRDFPFPYPPLTFLIQAALIKFTGRVFWHTTVYCAAIGGVATLLTWRILVNLLGRRVAHARLLAFILSFPVLVLGVYSVFPHPFYDPDCTVAILLAVLLLQSTEAKPSSLMRPALAGIALVLPAFVKQNTGLAFLGSAFIGLLILSVVERCSGRSARRYMITLLAAFVALAVGLLLVKFTAGLNNYWQWTIKFAAARRAPAGSEMLQIYEDKFQLLWIGIFITGLVGSWLNRKRSQWISLASALTMSLPFAWPTIYLFRDQDSSERAERLLALWPLILIISLVLTILTMKQRRGWSLILPFVLIATVNGAFMSQQLWGSTYALWPLFIILSAEIIVSLSILLKERLWTLLPLTATIGLSLLISGAFYIRSHERLDYANLDEGVLTKSTLPQLKGMATRGDWLPNFEELVRYTEREIPRDDGILFIPGEDPFYYTTGRRPLFPVLSFDHTVNPYSPPEILKLARDRNIRWLIVKQDLQDEDEELEKQRDQLTEALEQDFEQVESLKNYDVYRRTETR